MTKIYKYIFMFENKGESVGVTMPHPHAKIYGYSVVPKRIEGGLSNSKNILRMWRVPRNVTNLKGGKLEELGNQ